MSHSDFDGVPFIAGSFVGLRSFNVDRLGRLTATQFLDAVWRPGENTATCRKSGLNIALSSYMNNFSVWLDPSSGLARATPKPPAVSLKKKPPHRVAGLDCTCGFYAYYDGKDDYREFSRISGVVEGYGRVTTGSRGFRAERAVVVALIIRKRQTGEFFDRVRRNYPDVPVFERKRDALAVHPLSPPEKPTPDTDPDFWTRTAS